MKLSSLVFLLLSAVGCSSCLAFQWARGAAFSSLQCHRIPKHTSRRRMTSYSELYRADAAANLAKQYMLRLLKNKPGANYTYDVSRCGYFVDEMLLYEDEHDTSAQIVKEMHYRHKERKDKNCPWFESVNPMFAVCGSTGSGKSTLLARFPASDEYRGYLQQYTPGCEPIVVPLTFARGMGGGPPSIGLRVLFGAAVAMGLIPYHAGSWLEFADALSGAEDLLGWDAPGILRKVFGADRPVIILADELDKAPKDYDMEVLKHLGQVLMEENNDVLVSAVTPLSVELRVQRSRRMKHFVPRPLLDSKLGEKECAVWAETMISRVPAKRRHLISQQNKQLLRSVHLLASGHPGTLSRLIGQFKDVNSWKSLLPFITENSTSLLLARIAKKFDKLGIHQHNVTVHSEEARRILLTGSDVMIVHPTAAHPLLEGGACYYERKKSPGAFTIAVTLPMLLNEAAALQRGSGRNPTKSSNSEALMQLFDHNKYSDISQLWERAVDMTIIGRSHDTPLSIDMTLGRTWGEYHRVQQPFALYLANSSAAQDLQWRDYALIVLRAEDCSQLGYDSKLCCAVEGKQLVYYNVMNIGLPEDTKHDPRSLSIKYVQAMVKCLVEHLSMHTTDGKAMVNDKDSVAAAAEEAMSRFHMTFYQWDSNGTTANGTPLVTKEYAVAALQVMQLPDAVRACAAHFVEQFWDKKVRILYQPELEKWLLPSLLPIPRLVLNVNCSGK